VRFEKKWARFEFRGESYSCFKFGLRIRVFGEVLEGWGGFGFVDRVGFRDMIYFVDRVDCRDMIYFVDRVSFVGWKRMDRIKLNQNKSKPATKLNLEHELRTADSN
jgi:hypothetical protein